MRPHSPESVAVAEHYAGELVSLVPERRPPEELLAAADAALRRVLPALDVLFELSPWRYRAKLEYPGSLAVYSVKSGALLTRSRPGRLTTPCTRRRR